MAILEDYGYRPSTSHLKQGVKGGRCPRNAVAGGNGTFIVSDGPKVTLYFRGPRGGKFTMDVSEDTATYIHGYLGRRVTEKQVRKIYEPLIGQKIEVNDKKNSIIDIGKYFLG